jgi:hypothetical protein
MVGAQGGVPQSSAANVRTVCRDCHASEKRSETESKNGPALSAGPHASHELDRARQLTRVTSTRLSKYVGARPRPDQASDEIELTDPSERLSERQ